MTDYDNTGIQVYNGSDAYTAYQVVQLYECSKIVVGYC